MNTQDRINELKKVDGTLQEVIIALRGEGITNLPHNLKECRGIIRTIIKEMENEKDKLRQLKEWAWKNNSPKLSSPLDNMRLCSTDGGWINGLELQQEIDRLTGNKVIKT